MNDLKRHCHLAFKCETFSVFRPANLQFLLVEWCSDLGGGLRFHWFRNMSIIMVCGSAATDCKDGGRLLRFEQTPNLFVW